MARSAQSVVGLLDKIHSIDITVYQYRCVAVRNRHASCTRCADACTSGAIAIKENELVIEPQLCVGCGTCATVCPTCALEAHHPNDAQLQSAAMAALCANDGVSVLACKQVVDAARNVLDTSKVVAVECLGRIEESLLMALVGAGATKVLMVRGDCDACERKTGLDTALRVCDTANTLLDTWKQQPRVAIVDRFPASVRAGEKGYDESKRYFFFQTKESAKTVGVAAVEEALHEGNTPPEQPRYIKVQDDGTLPHFIPDRRERLLDSLAQMGEPKDELIETRLWGHVLIDPDICTSCLMCTTFCPTGALKRVVGEDGSLGIDHYPGDCVYCKCCQDICRVHALTCYNEVFAPDILSGTVEHNELHPPKYDMNSSKRARTIFRDLLKCDDIYDR